MKKIRNNKKWLYAAIIAALPTGTMLPTANAQQRVGDDGRALDANNRIGSGGYNHGGVAPLPNVTGNQIITGNVTGGRAFRGAIGYTDPGAFRDVTTGNVSDRFVRDSAGVPNDTGAPRDLTQPMPYYGVGRAAPPPPQFVREAPGGGYVPAPPIQRQTNDLRLGNPIDAPVVNLPRPGELVLPGQVDPTRAPNAVVTGSPLYGVRVWPPGESGDQASLENAANLRRYNASDRFRVDDETIQRMREELQNTQPEQPEEQQRNPQEPMTHRIPQPFETPADAALPAGRVSADVDTSPLEANLSTDQSLRRRLIAPARQSTQYAELQRRLDRYHGNQPLTDEQANRDFRSQLRARDAAEAKKTALRNQNIEQAGKESTPKGEDMNRGGAASGTPGEPLADKNRITGNMGDPLDEPLLTNPPPIVAPADPLKIESLATGVSAEGLANVLKSAEDLMQQGKFTSALDQYNLAEQVAPNNPLIWLGRAHAELGASYYARAEGHLRQAIAADPALLMGQYDLRKFIGQDRLQFIINDLKEIANAEKNETRPVFLLAYISYNLGNTQRAADYLAMTEQRGGGADEVTQLLRQHWQLSPESKPDPLQK